MNERIFQKICRGDWSHFFPSSHYVKIPDSIRSGDYRFIPYKPYDSYILLGNLSFALEYKYSNNLRAIPLEHFHQDYSLLEASRNGGISYYVVGVEAENKSEIPGVFEKYAGKKFRMLFFLSPLYTMTWKVDFGMLENQKSVKIKELFKYSDFVVGRYKKENESKIHWRFDEFVARILKQFRNFQGIQKNFIQ